MSLGVKGWVRRMKAINVYLPLIDAACPKFTKQELVQHRIAPNIPDQWRLTFQLSRGHLAATVQDASIVLEELECDKLKKKKKESNNRQEIKATKAIKTAETAIGKTRATVGKTEARASKMSVRSTEAMNGASVAPT